MIGRSSIARLRTAPSALMILVSVCFALCAAPGRAQTSANSSAVAVEVTGLVDFPVLPDVALTLGPLPAGVMNSGTAPYSTSASVASASLAPLGVGTVLTTGLLIGTASSLVPGTEQVDGAASVDDLQVNILGSLVNLVGLSADVIQSTAQISGSCSGGMLTRTGSATLTNASISISGGMPTGIVASPAPNTPLAAGTLGPLGISIILNEQIATGDGTTFAGLTVRAIHISFGISVLGVFSATADIIIGESQAELVCDAAEPTPTATATATATTTGMAAGTASATATASATGTGTSTAIPGTATSTRTATRTGTVTQTRTVTGTPTPGPPVIFPPLHPSATRVPGSGPPNRTDGQMLICLIGGPNPSLPNVPPCTAPDSIISMCGTNAGGQFVDNSALGCIVPPLQIGQCVYAYDTVTMLISNVVCVTAPSPAPTLSGPMIGAALAVLASIAGLALRRRRRPGADPG